MTDGLGTIATGYGFDQTDRLAVSTSSYRHFSEAYLLKMEVTL